MPSAPTAVLMGVFTPGTPEWEEARSGLCVTATEIAAVLGLSPWQSKFSLWHKKAGLVVPPVEQTAAMKWGSRLEDDVFEEYAEQHPEHLVMPTGTWQHKDRPWQRATPDRLLYPIGDNPAWEGTAGIGPEPIGIAEAKTSPFGDDWGPDGTDQVPIYYRCQVIWQQDTLGFYGRTPICVLISGCEYRELYVDYDPADAELMRNAARQFLDDVANGVRPPIDTSDATYQTIRVQPEGREDADVEIAPELADEYAARRAAVTAAEAELTGTKSRILDAIGDGYRAVVGDRRVAYRTVKPDGTTRALMPYDRKKANAA